MDDDKLKAEFPLGDLMITVREPSPGQMFALSLSRTGNDADMERTVRRLLKVLEALTGPEQWYGVIEDALISERITPQQLMALSTKVFEFKWADHHEPAATPVTVEAKNPEPLPADPQPRILRG